MGKGLDEHNVLGPLQNSQQFDIVAGLVEAAKRLRRARCCSAATRTMDQPGYFYPTTLVADIDNSNPLVAEEQFGPALPIIRYSTVDEAVAMANGLDVGLGASVWSSDPARAREVAARIEAGTVWINKHGAVDPRVPFGDGGRATPDLGPGDASASALAVDAQGRIVVVGHADDFFVALRLRADGRPDPAFGDHGVVRVELAGGPSSAYVVVLQPDGDIVLAGTSGTAPHTGYALARLHDDGTLDESFGTGGHVEGSLQRRDGERDGSRSATDRPSRARRDQHVAHVGGGGPRRLHARRRHDRPSASRVRPSMC